MFVCKVLVVAALIGAGYSVPAGFRTSCGSGCSDAVMRDSFFYEYSTGYTYEYDYKSEATTTTGNGEVSPGMSVEGTVKFSIINPCEYVLQLSNVVLRGSDKSAEFASAVTRYPLRFSFQNGVVESVCASDEEPTWVTNFKRGIISSFQNSIHTKEETTKMVTETDISGECETVYEVTKDSRFHIIKKTKESSKCSKRPGSELSTFGFSFDSLISGVSPLNSVQECVQRIPTTQSVYQNVDCVESHTYVPFTDNEDIKVETKVTTSLVMKSQQQGISAHPEPYAEKSTLLYQQTEREMEMAREKLNTLLTRLVDSSQDDIIDKEVSSLFTDLVHAVKSSSERDLFDVYTTIHDSRAKKFFIDAIVIAGTGPSTQIMAQLISSNEISLKDQDIFFTSLVFKKEITKEMLASLYEILQKNKSPKALFGVSSAVNAFCQINSECETVEEVSEIIRLMESLLGVNCRAEGIDINYKVSILKALGNTGRFINAPTTLNRCFTEENPMEIRLAAIDAWRRTPCSYSRNVLVSLFEDGSQPDELRIASYMAIMRCPTQSLISSLKNRLVSEEVNQVTSFVYSHLSQIRETADQDKQHIREMIGNELVQDKFNADDIKFSRYFESSIFSKSAEVGETSEGTIIFDSESYLPRSANFNLTMNIFGQSVNVMEFVARMEGYEEFAEKFFGPEGYFPDETIQELLKNLKGHKNVEKKDPQASVSLRMFGNQLLYKSHIGTDNILEQLGISNPMDVLFELIRNKKIEFMKNFNILSTRFTVPTISGLPIIMDIDGTATVALDIAGEYNVDSMDSMHIDGKIKPSASVQLSSKIIIDAFVTQSGVKYVSTLHSATQLEGRAVVKGVKMIDFSLKAPKKDIKIYDFSQEFFTISDGQEVRKEVQQDKQTACKTCDIFGVSFCTEVYDPRVPTLVKVPSRSIYIKKTDTHTSYDFQFIGESTKMSILLDRPGSSMDVKKSLSLSYDGKSYDFSVHTSNFDGRMRGQVLNDQITAEFIKEGKTLYTGSAQLHKDTSNGLLFKPVIVVKDGQGQIISDFSLKLEHDRTENRYAVEAKHTGDILIPAGEINLVWEIEKRQRKVTLFIDSPKLLHIDFNGSGKLKRRSIGLDLSGTYRVGSNPEKKIKLSLGGKKEKIEDGIMFEAHAKIPFVKLDAASSLELGQNRVKTIVDFSYRKFDFAFQGELEKQRSADMTTRTMNTEFSSKYLNYKMKSTKKIVVSADHINMESEVIVKDMVITQQLSLDSKKQIGSVELSGNRIFFFESVRGSDGKISLQCQWGISEKHTVTGSIHNRSSGNKIDADLHLAKDQRSLTASLLAERTHLALDVTYAKDKYTKSKSSDYKIHLNATPNKFHFETNLFRRVLLDAKIDSQSELTRAEVSAEYENMTPIEIIGEYSPTHVEAKYTSGEQTVRIFGEIAEKSIEAHAQWAPTKKIAITTTYDFKESPVIFLSVLTPFTGWEKQEARFSYSLHYPKLKGQLSLVWKNTEHITSNFNVVRGPADKIDVRMSLTSTIKHFERIEFNLLHNGFQIEADTEMIVKYRESVVHAKINGREMPNGFGITALFDSPLNEKMELDMSFRAPAASYLIEADAKHGDHTSKLNFALKGFKSGTSVKIFVSSTHLPQIDLSGSFKSIPNCAQCFKLDISGTIDSKNVQVSVDGIRGSSSDEYSVALKAVQPFTEEPILISMKNLVSDEYTVFRLDSSHTLKLHPQPISLNVRTNCPTWKPTNAHISVELSGPNTELFVKAHNVMESQKRLLNIDTELQFSYNSRYIKTQVSGEFVPEKLQGSLTVKLRSSCSHIDGFSIRIEHIMPKEERIISMDLMIGGEEHKLNGRLSSFDENGGKVTVTYNEDAVLKFQLEKKANKFNLLKMTAKTSYFAFETFVGNSEDGKKLSISLQRPNSLHYATIQMKGDIQSGSIFIETSVPAIYDGELVSNLSYDLRPRPAIITGTIKSKDMVHNFRATFGPESFFGSLDDVYTIESNWLLVDTEKKFTYKIQAPEHSCSMEMIVNTGASQSVSMRVRRDDIEYTLNGHYSVPEYTIDVQGPQTKITAKVVVNEQNLEGSVNHNGDVIVFSLSGNFQPLNGKAHAQISSTKWEKVKGEWTIDYKFDKDMKTVQFDGKLGSEEFSFDYFFGKSLEHAEQTDFSLKYQTPFEVFRKGNVYASTRLASVNKAFVLTVTTNNVECLFKIENEQDEVKVEISSYLSQINLDFNFNTGVFIGKCLLSGSANSKTSRREYLFGVSLPLYEAEYRSPEMTLHGKLHMVNKGAAVFKADITSKYQQGFVNSKFTWSENRFSTETKVQINNYESKFSLDSSLGTQNIIDVSFERDGKEHKFFFSNELSYSKGEAELKMNMFNLDPIDVKVNYDLTQSTKNAMLRFNVEQISEKFAIAFQLPSFDSELGTKPFLFSLETPFEGYRTFTLSGSIEVNEKEYGASGNMVIDTSSHEFTGTIAPSVDGYTVSIQCPSRKMNVKGSIGSKFIDLYFHTDSTEKFLKASYALNSNLASFTLDSSFEVFKFEASHTFKQNEGIFGLLIERNDYRFESVVEFFVSTFHTIMNFEIHHGEAEPVQFRLQYDLESPSRDMEVMAKFDDEEYFARAHFFHAVEDPMQGLIEVTTSFPQFKLASIEYDFEQTQTIIDGTATIKFNDFINVYKTNIEHSEKVFSVDVKTPHIGLSHVTFSNELSIEKRYGKIMIQLEDSTFSFEAAMHPEKVLFDLVTPLEKLSHARFVLSNVWKSSERSLQFGFGYNEDIFEVGARVLTMIDNAGFEVKLQTPFTKETHVKMVYNLQDLEQLFDFIWNVNAREYVAKIGLSFEEYLFSLSAKVNMPVEYLKDFSFMAILDMRHHSKGLKLYLKSNGHVHIDLEGLNANNETSFAFHIPSELLGNINTSGKINRSKRAILMGFGDAKGAISSNFHSVKITINSPFKRLQNFEISVARTPKGKLTIDYKRNDNFLHYESFETKKAKELKLEASLPGWELLALTGRLDHETIEKYLTGELEETPMTIQGKGSLGRRTGSAKITAKTGLEKLGTVTVDFNYKRKRSYTLKAVSDVNNDFKVLIDFKNGGLIIDVFIPHSEVNTVAKGSLTLFKGELEITSRFKPILNYKLTYEAVLKEAVKVNVKIVRNDVVRFNFEFEKEGEMGHLLLEIRIRENHSKLHYHRMGMKELEAAFERNGKILSVKLTGEGNLPTKGDIAYVIKNSFREVTKEITGRIAIDRTSSPKTITVDVNVQPHGRQYTVNLDYNVDLKNLREGDFSLNVNSPSKIALRIKPIKAEWSFNEQKVGTAKISYADITYVIKGKVSLRNTEITIDSTRPNYGPTRTLGWRYERNPPSRSYYFKYGTASTYTLFELNGDIEDLRNGDVKGRFRLRRMDNDLVYTAKWSGNKDVGISGDGTFELGEKKGSFKLHKLKRDPERRASTFRLTGTSNIKNFKSYEISGEYDISAKMIDVKAKWDSSEFAIDMKLNDFSKEKSENKASFKIPGIGPVDLVLSHDFTNPLDKTIEMHGTMNGKPFKYKEHWTRNEDRTVLNADVDIDSNIFGVIKMTASYDVRDMNNAKADIVYTRDGANNVNVNWHRTVTENNLDNELIVKSKSKILPNIKVYAKADTSNGVEFKAGAEWGKKSMKTQLTVKAKKAEFTLDTPFPAIGSASAVATYKFSPKKKDITFHYERGDKVIDMTINLETPNKKNGSLKVSLTTPFDVVKTLSVDGAWEGGQLTATYKRNDVEVKFSGTASVKQGNSSFDVTFTLPSGKDVSLKLSYNLPDFIEGISKQLEEILNLDLKIGEKFVQLTLQGYRTSEKITLELHGGSSRERLREFHVKLDSELNLINRVGMLDVKINDFTFDMKNKFERLDDGYYCKSQMHSSITDLPGLTVGYGRDGKARTLTLGYGDEREVSITFHGKDRYKKGFYGKIDIPRRGIFDIQYDINYNFKGDNRVVVQGEATLPDGRKIDLGIDYHSDGVKGRLTSPWTGKMRARRSISDNAIEFQLDDSLLATLQGETDTLVKKGIVVSGMLFGKKVGIQAYRDFKSLENSEAKLIIETPFENFERLGGFYKIKKESGKLQVLGEIDLFIKVESSFEIEKKSGIKGLVTFKKSVVSPKYFLNIEGTTKNNKLFAEIKLSDDQQSTQFLLQLDSSPKKYLLSAIFQEYSMKGLLQKNKRNLLNIIVTVQNGQAVLHKIAFNVLKKNFEIDSSVKLGNLVDFRANIIPMKLMDAALVFDGEEHSLNIESSPIESGQKATGTIRSPLIPSGQMNIVYMSTLTDSLKVFLQGEARGITHTVNVEADLKPALLVISVESPLVQSGRAKAEARIRGRSWLNMKAKFVLENANNGYTTKIVTDMNSKNKKTLDVEFNSPIEKFEKVKFGTGYSLDDQLHNVYMYAKPLNFKTLVKFGVAEDAYTAGFELLPGSTELPVDPIVSEIVVPLDSFTPKISMTLGKDQYDLEVTYQTDDQMHAGVLYKKNGFSRGIDIVASREAPFELGYEFFNQTPHANTKLSEMKFHIMFDSSFQFLRDQGLVFLY